MGEILGNGSVRVNEKTLVGLRQAHPPKTKKALRSVLGMWNLYQPFLKDDIKVAGPLLTMKDAKVADTLPEFIP